MQAARPELGAALDHVCVSSPEPQRLAEFFKQMLGARAGRALTVAGRPNCTAYIAYGFTDEKALARYRSSLLERGLVLSPSPSPRFDDRAFAVADPDGNIIVFGVSARDGQPADMAARLQHVVFRSPNIDAMVQFYEHSLRFVVSDRVRDAAGVLRACFLRTDAEHHSLAVFRAPEARLDHHSYETGDWNDIRRWADRMSEQRIAIFWGVGRHGPGNDLFFMVKDPDGNLVEISAEIEVCAPDRPEGLWPHEPRTLNLWGNAIMRS